MLHFIFCQRNLYDPIVSNNLLLLIIRFLVITIEHGLQFLVRVSASSSAIIRLITHCTLSVCDEIPLKVVKREVSICRLLPPTLSFFSMKNKRMLSSGSFYPVLGLASCAAFIYMSFGDLMMDLSFQKLPQMSFVQRNGSHFVVDGREFYVNGWNSYWLMDQAVEEFSRPRVAEMFQIGAKMGLTVCRTWAFNDGAYNALQIYLGKFDERVFKALDRVIYEANRHGVRLILCLVNNLQAFGGKTQYVKWALEKGIVSSSSNDSFFSEPSIRNYFKLYLKTVLTRRNHLTGVQYRNDPTIFAWELMNEPRCMSDPTGDTLQEWIEDMAAYVKSIDNKHLLTIGLEGFYGPTSRPNKLALNPSDWFSKLGVDFIRNSRIPQIDFASVHSYPDQWLFKAVGLERKLEFMSNWVNSHIEDGEEMKKPVLFTEFGLKNKGKNLDHSDRDKFFTFIFDIIYESAKKKRSGGGAFIWQLFVGDMEEYSDNYGIVPTVKMSLYRLITYQSCRLAAITKRISSGSYC